MTPVEAEVREPQAPVGALPKRRPGSQHPGAGRKRDLYREVLPLLNGHRVELLDHPRLGAQLRGLERRTSRGGRDSIDHAPGGHDDVANAVAGAVVAAAHRRVGVRVVHGANLAAERYQPVDCEAMRHGFLT